MADQIEGPQLRNADVWRLKAAQGALRRARKASEQLRLQEVRERLERQLQDLTARQRRLAHDARLQSARPNPNPRDVRALANRIADHYRSIGDLERTLSTHLPQVELMDPPTRRADQASPPANPDNLRAFNTRRHRR